ncbi:Rrf2 family transcriptional regulator [Sphingobium sufflavum]|uniref:RrF2 family transcriptional regulator n=1 Tax=Sphingobium sufflavum TaxID=1129547 RepID=UPI001F37B4D6|nr:Rrf2 family transcriptional regulator [Sphingobium sufflavum]MCE7796145.1 Rrf2 family transcriptional regulator [Sphingobium sufflavum]
MLSQQSRYALKALIHLATQNPDKPHPTAEIAAAANVPRKFLEAILLDLKIAGIVHSTRGKAGGYALARTAKEITFGDVIRVTDGPLALIHCASKKFYRRCLDCPDEQACNLRSIMIEAREQLSAVLDNRTIADALSAEFAPEDDTGLLTSRAS